ncbi:MAG: hypothetical protein GWN67_19210 [Phycisphaerae bacterium]|nr:hypothetical protein [Phycisphaerae bacterium]NIP54318.1 hypothetical protein [Phycisphaerae bacterium]NIS53187.1 hypothetical protein [Phycisphaerae bacterium]NIU10672.1 hypothetical protein [Phycisphaerae bacterium]NIU58433.1 hypothetical protein [Phycisphaerae bacterium]
MSLVKWFRKNKTKVMAIVAIGTLASFMGLGTFLSFISKRSTGLHKTVAYCLDNRKITRNDIFLAQEELRILQLIGSGELLRNIGVPLFNTPDLRALFMGELLFSERRTSPGLINYIKQTVRTNDYRISDKQIIDIYKPTVPSEIYWICLSREAEQAGMRISKEDARRLLVNAYPKVPQFEGATYSQIMRGVVKQRGISEEKILTTFGKLLSIWEYAKMNCSGEDITSSEIMHSVSRERETIDVNFVKFDSAVFAESQSEPNEESISSHFNQYKQYFAGTVSKENPYGFGYKLLDRVQLEYIVCRLDDVSKIVTPPTQEEAEEFYRRNRSQFTEEVLSDPNDPNSLLTERVKGYSEVASQISDTLLQNKINSKAKSIMDEAKALTESGLRGKDTDVASLTVEQLKELAGDYKAAVDQLSQDYNIKVYTGTTGLLGAAYMQLDDSIGRLYVRGYGNNVIGLTQLVFAVDELGLSELGPFSVSRPRMYENIGPVRDILGRMMAIVRVIDVEKATEPESINQTFNVETIKFETSDEQANREDPNLGPDGDLESEEVFSVKEKVTADLKRLSAMEVTKEKAGEFLSLVAKEGWESSIEKFNNLYGENDVPEESDPNVADDPNGIKDADGPFMMESSTNLQRISREAIGRLAVLSEGNPGAPLFVKEAQSWLSVSEAKIAGQFIDQLYSLVPPDSNTAEALPILMGFKPEMSYYCINDILIRRVVREEYEQIKPIQVFRDEYIQFQNLAAVHFNPANILKRTRFRGAEEENQASDANTPAESEEAS